MKRARAALAMLCVAGLGWAGAAWPQAAVVGVPASAPAGLPGAGPLGAPQAVDERWRSSLDAFAAADKQRAPRLGGIVFVGSSTIRLWNDLETQFDNAIVIQRGFGGSRMSDCASYVDQLVLPYKPRLVVVYAGDNDLAEGRLPQQVLESFTEFVGRVRQALPATRIAYVSIKPSPLRAALMPRVVETNALIEQYTHAVRNLDFIDIYSSMLDAEGHPRAELFQADMLHLNASGYAVWKGVIAGHLGLDAQTPPP